PLANWLLPSALSFGGLLAVGLIGAAFGMSQSELLGDAVVPEASAIAAVIGSPAQPSMRIEEIHHVKTLPVEKFHDMSFVFSDGDSTAGVIAAAASEEPRKNWFTPRCAERDLHAFVVIEELGDLGEVPTAWLADAGLNYVQARGYCLSGAES